MKFNHVIQAPCLIPADEAEPIECTTPSTDERCQDPVFAAANPELCKFFPELRIKPEIATICANKTILFKTYLYTNGKEVEVSGGLEYTSSNPAIVVIGAASGSATGVNQGIATIGVTWNELHAHAQLTVMVDDNCCDSLTSGFLLLMDKSKSMSTAFTEMYATKMSFAKHVAHQFTTTINTTKDYLAVWTFDEAVDQFLSLDKDAEYANQVIDSLTTTENKTDIYQALSEAITYLNAAALNRRIIVLFTDGDQRALDPEDIRNPIPLADAFKASGGIIIVVGTRAYGAGFELLEQISSNGFLLNGYSANQADVADYLSGLKSYVCGGGCAPAGDIISSTPQLNYQLFQNWYLSGRVDLIGEGSGGVQLFDLIPGHGLYVDLCGTTGLGRLTSKSSYTLAAGKSYRLTIKAAGNQRESRADSIKVKVGTLLSDTIDFDITHWHDLFADYIFNITGDGGSHQIVIEQGDIGLGSDAVGSLIDDIRLENITDGTVMLLDTFDGENRIYLPPGCGTSYYGNYYYSGYDCYGCLDGPLPVQKPDPNEAFDPEVDELPPTTYTSTKTYTAACTNPAVGSNVTKTATATSVISQADADTKATAEARAQAEAALSCTTPKNGGGIVINDSGPANPYPSIMVASGISGTIKKITVGITGFTHHYPTDVDMLLVGPTGRAVMLMSDCGGGTAVAGINLVVDDGAVASFPASDPITAGTYKPTNYGAADGMPAPAPGETYYPDLSAFVGLDPNGSWYLFIFDDHDFDSGSITSWTINFTT